LALLAACSSKPPRAPCPADKVCLEYGNTSEPTSLDPQKISLSTESTIVGDMMVGLVEDGPDGAPVPGIAESWETSKDGLVWTFHLRKAEWSDGVPVTADDFVFSFRRILDPKTASPYAYLPALIRNGAEVTAGKLPPTALGVRAIDARTLELTLEHPAAYLPQALKHHSFYPVPEHAVRRWGDAWARPARYVSDGPYRPTAWVLGDHITVVKNPRFYDAAHVCVDRIDYYATADAISAERRVKRGELDVNTTVQSNRVPFLKGPRGMPAYLRLYPYLGVAYMVFNTRDIAAFRDVRVRQALSMSVDRDFITGKLLRAGQSSAYAFVPPGVAGYQSGAGASWETWPLARRQAEARRLLAAAGYGAAHPLTVEIKLPFAGDAPVITPAIQADWKAVGVKAALIQNEGQVAYESLYNRDFQVGLASWIGDYDDPMTFLELMQSSTGAQNYGDYSNPAYDALLSRADHEPDAARRAAYLKQAEQIMLDDAAVAPLYFLVSRNLVSPRITGWVGNVLDFHRARYFCAPASGG
jgi:oligopeptide transport system substrate-binding protein